MENICSIQAMQRYIHNQPQAEFLIQTNDQVCKFMKKLHCLPLLPPDDIRPAFDLLKGELPQNFEQTLRPILNHFERYWLGTVGKDSLSVFGHAIRTNNNVESLNRILRIEMGDHPPIWHFFGNYTNFAI